MSEPTSPRDELVTLLSKHHIVDHEYTADYQTVLSACRCGSKDEVHRAHLADVLLAAGYRKIHHRLLLVGDSFKEGESKP